MLRLALALLAALRHAMDDLRAGGTSASVQHALILTFALAFVSCLIFLRRRLGPSVQSCEEKTGPESSPSRKRRRTHAQSSLPSNSDSGEQGRALRPDPKEARTSVNHESQTSREEGIRMGKRVKQAYDAFLVLDVEATCVEGSDFAYPNEIIVSLDRLASVFSY